MVNKILFISALIGAVCIGWYLSNTTPVSQLKTPAQTFVIPKGQSTRAILRRLQQEKIIKSSLAAEIYLLLTQQRQGLQAGSFELSESMPLNEIAATLQRGTLDIKITIPEGFRSEQIVDTLIKSELLVGFTKQDLYQKFKIQEGQLFPDTYFFPKESPPEKIIEKMTENFNAKTSSLTDEDISAKGRSASGGNPLTHELIIQASLVEREARHDIDRSLIASVLKNRLKIGMALQIDA
ncbi:MAG: endolytic transglycosylase MltG, partial [Patescibacteria group bacterium]